jgi:hypothetical protein
MKKYKKKAVLKKRLRKKVYFANLKFLSLKNKRIRLLKKSRLSILNKNNNINFKIDKAIRSFDYKAKVKNNIVNNKLNNLLRIKASNALILNKLKKFKKLSQVAKKGEGVFSKNIKHKLIKILAKEANISSSIKKTYTLMDETTYINELNKEHLYASLNEKAAKAKNKNFKKLKLAKLLLSALRGSMGRHKR